VTDAASATATIAEQRYLYIDMFQIYASQTKISQEPWAPLGLRAKTGAAISLHVLCNEHQSFVDDRLNPMK